MEQQEIWTFKVLEAIDIEPVQSQRKLSRKLSLSLGTVNKFIKDLSIQGFIKVDNIARNKTEYILTSKGVAEKIRLKGQHITHCISFYQKLKRTIRESLPILKENCENCLVFYGTGDLCEIACVTAGKAFTRNLKVIDNTKVGKRICGLEIFEETILENLTFDAIVIMDLVNNSIIRSKLINKGISVDKIYEISLD